MLEKSIESHNLPQFFESLAAVCSVEKDGFGQGAYILRFLQGDARTTVRIILDDQQSGADLVITNMTTLPEAAQHQGYGSMAIEKLIAWAKDNNLTNVQAVQVKSNSERFWTSNGFEKMNNETNDFRYSEAEI